jgi:hypothetical protein
LDSSDAPTIPAHPENQPPPPIGFNTTPQGFPSNVPTLPAFGANQFDPQVPTVVPTDVSSLQYSWIKTTFDVIPSAAFPGGKDLNGETLFVGRAEHEGSLTPGKVSKTHKGCLLAWGGKEHGKVKYEILVGSARWIQGTGQTIPPNAIEGKSCLSQQQKGLNLNGFYFAGGRTEDGETLYIGRVKHDGTLTIGKVQPSHGVCYIPYGGKEIRYSDYEILAM